VFVGQYPQFSGRGPIRLASAVLWIHLSFNVRRLLLLPPVHNGN
jgi:hypothetical protein